jgi:hypothetical protein
MERPRHPDFAARLFGAKPEHTLALLRAAWPGAVGEELSRRTEVVAFDHGLLRIKVPDMRWQRTLVRMRGFILDRLRRVAGRAAPRGLSFVTGEFPTSDAAIPATPLVAAVAPAPASVAKAAEAIPDPDIRERFLASAGRYLSRFGAPRTDSRADSGKGSTGS